MNTYVYICVYMYALVTSELLGVPVLVSLLLNLIRWASRDQALGRATTDREDFCTDPRCLFVNVGSLVGARCQFASLHPGPCAGYPTASAPAPQPQPCAGSSGIKDQAKMRGQDASSPASAPGLVRDSPQPRPRPCAGSSGIKDQAKMHQVIDDTIWVLPHLPPQKNITT